MTSARSLFRISLFTFAAMLLFAAVGCVDNDPEEGWADMQALVPDVRSVTYYGTDEVLTEGYFGDLIAVNGSNLSEIIEVKFNDRKAVVLTSLVTDATVPVVIPSDRPIRTTDKLYLSFRGQDVVLNFHVICQPNPESRPIIMDAWREDMSRPVSKAYGGERLVLTGYNLKSTVGVACGNSECTDLQYSASDDAEQLSFLLPRESECDMLLLRSESGKKYPFRFKVMAQAPVMPVVKAMSCEWAPAGYGVTLKGEHFEEGMSVAFGNTSVAAESIKVTDSSTAAFTMPAGVADGARLICVAPGGDDYTASEIFYRDTRGMLFDFEPSNVEPIPLFGGVLRSETGGNGWLAGASGGNTKVRSGYAPKATKIGYDPTFALTSPYPGYLQLGNDPERGVAWTAHSSRNQFSMNEGLYNLFTYWGVADGETAYNNQVSTSLSILPSVAPILAEYPVGELALKFELRVPDSKPWSAQSLQIIFTSLSTVRNVEGSQNLSYIQSSSQPRAVYCPWHTEADGSFDTANQWITVVIPLADFNQTFTGDACSRCLTKDDLTGLTLFFGGGAFNGTECRPLLQIDNIRIVKI